jgi:TolA-binding protein
MLGSAKALIALRKTEQAHRTLEALAARHPGTPAAAEGARLTAQRTGR